MIAGCASSVTFADGLIRDFHPTAVLDAGCAMGFLVEQLRKKGVDAKGFDVSEYAISQVDESAAPYCKLGSLTDPVEGRYDLITCIEVLEHLPPEQADTAIANLCSATDLVVMSSTPGDYGEPTHLNVMQPEDWATKFAQNGFLRDLDRDLSYLSHWASVYVRREEIQVETVRRYDRGWWRLRREVDEVRESLLAAQKALEAERDRPQPPDQVSGDEGNNRRPGEGNPPPSRPADRQGPRTWGRQRAACGGRGPGAAGLRPKGTGRLKSSRGRGRCWTSSCGFSAAAPSSRRAALLDPNPSL